MNDSIRVRRGETAGATLSDGCEVTVMDCGTHAKVRFSDDMGVINSEEIHKNPDDVVTEVTKEQLTIYWTGA